MQELLKISCQVQMILYLKKRGQRDVIRKYYWVSRLVS